MRVCVYICGGGGGVGVGVGAVDVLVCVCANSGKWSGFFHGETAREHECERATG